MGWPKVRAGAALFYTRQGSSWEAWEAWDAALKAGSCIMNVVVRLAKLLRRYNYYEAQRYCGPSDILLVKFGGSFSNETMV